MVIIPISQTASQLHHCRTITYLGTITDANRAVMRPLRYQAPRNLCPMVHRSSAPTPLGAILLLLRLSVFPLCSLQSIRTK